MARQQAFVAAGLGVAAVVAMHLVRVDYRGFMDLRVYRAGGRAWLDGFRLYANGFAHRYHTRGLPFTYPPVAALLFVVFALMPFSMAVTVFTTVSVLALGVVAVIVVGRKWWSAILAVVVGGVLLEPVRLTLTFGQINLVLMALVVADCLLPRTRWPRGVLIGIAAAVKLTPIVFVLYFAAHRQWRPVRWVLAGFAGMTVLAWAVVPGDTPEYFSAILDDPGRIGGLDYSGNQSLNGLWQRFGLGHTTTTALWLVSSAAVAAIAWHIVRRARASGDDLGALLAAATAELLVSPVSWSHHWVWVVLAGVWLVPRLRDWRWPARIVSVATLALFVWPPYRLLPYLHDAERKWSWWEQLVGNQFTWCGLAFLVVLAVTYARREDPSSRRRTAGGDLEPEPL